MKKNRGIYDSYYSKVGMNLITDKCFICPLCHTRAMYVVPLKENNQVKENSVCLCFECDRDFYAKPQDDGTVTFVDAEEEEIL